MSLNLQGMDYISEVFLVGDKCVLIANREMTAEELDDTYGEFWDQGVSEDVVITVVNLSKKSSIANNPELRLIVDERARVYGIAS